MKTKLLFLCSANIDRSPAAESLFENSEKFEAKSAGLSELTENPVTKEMVDWADTIFVMEPEHRDLLFEKFNGISKDIIILNVPNHFLRYDYELERLLRVKLNGWL